MPQDFVQVQYESLADIAKRFQHQASAVEDQRSQVTRRMESLAAGGWQGRGAGAFFSEMRQEFLPALKRLVNALEQGSAVTDEIGKLWHQAEQEAAQPFRGAGESSAGTIAGAAVAAAGAAGGLQSMGVVSSAASLIGGFFKGIAADTLLPQRFVLRALTPNIARGNTTVAMLMDMLANRGRGLPLLRFDGPHGGTQFPHINIHPRLTGVPDPHLPISPRLLQAAGTGARILEGARRIALPVAIVTDVFRLGSAFHSDGNQIGGETKRTIGSVAGGWGGAFAGAKLGAMGGAALGGALGTVFPGIGNVVGAGVGGFVGGIVGGIGGALGGSWIGEKLGGLF